MFGKKIRVNDYKFTYGSDIVYINVYAVFRVKKSNEKFIIYSYDDKKLFYGSLYINGNILFFSFLNNKLYFIILTP